ncbi:MAG: hypothetical protein M1828_003611 [Chrysothrix sp. TS-e1954]|nr:MAG: hypothetical protein M1828_003611 [Chrysothrix sp. TS-e1954]
MRAASIPSLNPFQFFPKRQGSSYEKLPSYDTSNGAPASPGGAQRRSWSLHNVTGSRACKGWVRVLAATIVVLLVLGFFGGGRYKREHEQQQEEEKADEEHANTKFWEVFPRINGFYGGVKTLVPWENWEPDPVQIEMRTQPRRALRDTPTSTTTSSPSPTGALPLPLERYNPYPPYNSSEYLADHHPVQSCYLDEAETQPAPDIFVYPGVPQTMALPFFGSHKELGMRTDVCFERFGRMGAYGYGYNAQEGGLGLGMRSEQSGIEELWRLQPKIKYQDTDWAQAQTACFNKNKDRFAHRNTTTRDADSSHSSLHTGKTKKKLPRSAFVLRTWTGFEYTAHEIIALRSMINELALKSGGEYDVHLLLHVKDDTVPIWTSQEIYDKVIQENIPKEFWGITTLWSVQLMRMYYPGPFGEPPANIAGQEIHGVYRSAHFALQWFAQEHPEYDFVWNWEMDMRYSGHHYEFHNGVGEWAKRQPRRGLWERNQKFWIPSLHGDWGNFTELVDKETFDAGEEPVWGPVEFPNSGKLETPKENQPPRAVEKDNFEWGVGEEADLITFNPIFDPANTNWVFRKDISGYDLNLPIPPRRCAIVTVSRLSRRLLDTMHEETYIQKHSAFPEMWAPTVSFHHGFKAVYIPHPVYFDRKWPLDYLDQIFNFPETKIDSVFGWGEHNWLGSSFYYNSVFSGALWRRWLGEKEFNEGGAQSEIEGSGRMCLKSTLHHPIKSEASPE